MFFSFKKSNYSKSFASCTAAYSWVSSALGKYVEHTKTSFNEFVTKKHGYDPYQMIQYAGYCAYDPYENKKFEVKTIDMQRIDDLSTAMTEAMEIDMNQDTIKTVANKAVCSLVASASSGITSAILYGSYFLLNQPWFVQKNHRSSASQKVKLAAIRGYGVDFSSVVERPEALQIQIDKSNKHLRDVCLKTREAVFDAAFVKKINSYGGNIDKKPPFGDDWGFVDDDFSVRFEATMPSPAKAPCLPKIRICF